MDVIIVQAWMRHGRYHRARIDAATVTFNIDDIIVPAWMRRRGCAGNMEVSIMRRQYMSCAGSMDITIVST